MDSDENCEFNMPVLTRSNGDKADFKHVIILSGEGKLSLRSILLLEQYMAFGVRDLHKMVCSI